MVAVRSFYEWCDGHGLLRTEVVSKMTHVKYFAPGTRGGGEHGARRRVLVEELRAGRADLNPPRWIADDAARARLAALELPLRDRFLVDLLSTTGIRVGEALSLFIADLHFGGGSRQLGCGLRDPHFHVRIDNPVENQARAKGGPRTLFVHRDLVESYVDYALERRGMLSQRAIEDRCPHVFVNLYSEDRWLGRASSYSSVKRLIDRCSKRIGYDISGPHMLRHTFATRLGTWCGLRSGSARCGPSAARACLPQFDSGLHARHRSSDEEGHDRDDRAAGGTWRCPVTAAPLPPTAAFDADWSASGASIYGHHRSGVAAR